ncbi:MAG: HAD family phosphatase [Dehalococcoidia bacterium]|nr:HAD family phosphatase [Dehalococcoidia bacterium]
MPPARAVIFDMDGVLTDSEPAFHAAVNDILDRFGTSISLRDYERFIGTATPVMWQRMIALKRLPATLPEILDAYEAPLLARLREPRPPLPGARELLARLRTMRVPLGLCTASYRRWVDAILASAGIAPEFDVIVAADDVERTKPDPQPYERAAAALGLRADECVVIEDSVSGLTSALASGACVVQLRATGTAADVMPGVERVIASLDEFPSEWLAAGT